MDEFELVDTIKEELMELKLKDPIGFVLQLAILSTECAIKSIRFTKRQRKSLSTFCARELEKKKEQERLECLDEEKAD